MWDLSNQNTLIRCNKNIREGCLLARHALPDAPSKRHMKKQDIRADIARRIALGEGRSSIFRALKGQGLSDRTLANLIASHADPLRVAQHARLVQGMVAVSWVQLVLGVLIGLSLTLKMGSLVGLLLMAFVGGFAYLFVWGFRHNRAWAYNASLVLSIVNLPKALNDITTEPASSVFALTLGVAWIAYTWFVRSKLFPDFAVLGPRKVGGTYQFST